MTRNGTPSHRGSGIRGGDGVMFTFPRVKDEQLDKWSIKEQVKKVEEEAGEVVDSLYERLSNKPLSSWLVDLAEEVFDTIHASEVLLQMLQRKGVDIEATRRKVEEKNRAKGFYEEVAG